MIPFVLTLPDNGFFNLLATGYQYTADLVALEQFMQSAIVASAELNRIVTPHHAEAWEACLQNHPDRLFNNSLNSSKHWEKLLPVVRIQGC